MVEDQLRMVRHDLENLPRNTVIFVILIAGFALRIAGINVGLPDTPDPRETIIAEDVLNLIHFTAPPETYNWPGTAWFYTIAVVGKLLSLTGWHLTETRVILLARCINVFFSTAHSGSPTLSDNTQAAGASVKLRRGCLRSQCCTLPTNPVSHSLTSPQPSA